MDLKAVKFPTIFVYTIYKCVSHYVLVTREINIFECRPKMATVICVAYAVWIFHHFIRRIRLFLAYSPATLCRHAFPRLRECFNYRCGSCRWNFIRAFISLLYIFQFVRAQRVTLLSNRGRAATADTFIPTKTIISTHFICLSIDVSLLSQATVIILWGSAHTRAINSR